mgnify:CR=1 FL=1
MSRRNQPVGELLDAAREGDRGALARLLSLVERGTDEARTIGRLTYPLSGSGYTVGLTGAPGAGKSTLTSAMIGQLRAQGEKVAVLAIDPSSPFTGGAILGDRVRMQDHATDPGVFIRSMATRGHLGGLSLATPEAVRLLDAVGGDELLFGDGESRDQSYVCLVTAAAQSIGLLLRSTLIEASPDVPSETLAPPRWVQPRCVCCRPRAVRWR